MREFEKGDRIKCIARYGLQNIEINSIYTVDGYRKNGDVILKEFPHCAYSPNFFELVEDSAIKSNDIKIAAKSIELTVDDIDNYNISYQAELNKQLYEKWEKENPTIKKEGNNMIESMNLINLYADKHSENIEKETKGKIEESRKKCDIINKYNELVEKFEKDCDELYLSQFTEEEKNEILTTQDIIDDSDMQLRVNGGCHLKYYANNNFHNEEYFEIMNDRDKKLNEINNLVKTAKAHVGIAKTKEEVEEILTRYGIIKKGKLVID